MSKARTFSRTHLTAALALAAAITTITTGALPADLTATDPAAAVDAAGLRPVVIRDARGVAVGRLTVLREGRAAARVSVVVKGLTPGFHGFHLHTTGVCDPKAVDPATGQVSPFFTAGGHFDPGGGTHAGHAGDLPPLLTGQDGSGTASVVTDRFGLRELTDADGSAVIVHALPDNLANIPARYAPDGPDEATLRTGDAGGRVACGVIR
ncbi:MAG: superoxide dismutase [Nonomuraea sp.]|nr:superoxide dismutase [Nonomuraea sp.]NUP67630.1 superoxide dismutase [Nonomuraea sp.]NUP76756.1 superoxide dismutase [Nonomuraea sp.]